MEQIRLCRRLLRGALFRRIASQRGAAMIEMALVLPLLALLVFGVLQFGVATNYWHDETQLASQGARLAAVDRNPGASTLQEYIRQQAESSALRNGGSSTLPDPLQVCIAFPNGTDVGDPVQVSVQTSYHWLPIIGNAVGSPAVALVGRATMRLELPPTNYSEGCTT